MLAAAHGHELGAVGQADGFHAEADAEHRDAALQFLDQGEDFRRFLEAEGADFFYEDGHGMHTWDFWNEYLPRGLEWALKN